MEAQHLYRLPAGEGVRGPALPGQDGQDLLPVAMLIRAPALSDVQGSGSGVLVPDCAELACGRGICKLSRRLLSTISCTQARCLASTSDSGTHLFHGPPPRLSSVGLWSGHALDRGVPNGAPGGPGRCWETSVVAVTREGGGPGTWWADAAPHCARDERGREAPPSTLARQ